MSPRTSGLAGRREVPREWQERVFGMVQAWTDPGQIIASDIERWHRILGEAKAAIRSEIVFDHETMGPAYVEWALADDKPRPTPSPRYLPTPNPIPDSDSPTNPAEPRGKP